MTASEHDKKYALYYKKNLRRISSSKTELNENLIDGISKVFITALRFIKLCYQRLRVDSLGANPGARPVQGTGLYPLDCWDRGFESR